MALGIVVIGGGSVFAATRPTWQPAATMAVGADHSRPTVHSGSAVRSEMAARTLRSKTPAGGAEQNPVPPQPTSATSPMPSITYTVKSGDTLSGIAQWFKLHGYGGLYAANKAVIGADPNLIFPGQRITIAHGAMSLGRQTPGGSGE